MTEKTSSQQRDSECSGSGDLDYPVVRRLGHRLNHLYQWALACADYDDIWDLCCDHGRLGLHLHQALKALESATPSHVHLVDCVPGIIESLSDRYSPLLMDPCLSIHCLDAGDIPLPSNGRQLILIAGIGAGTMVNIVQKIIHRLDVHSVRDTEPNVEFMLSPNFNALELRHFLRQHSFELLKEEFVTDKGQHHEHLHLQYCPNVDGCRTVSPVGSDLWTPWTAEKRQYIKKLMTHYENCVRLGGDLAAQDALDAYRSIITFSE